MTFRSDETMSGVASLLTWRVSKHIPWLMPIQVSSVLSEEHLGDPPCSLCKRWRWCFVTREFAWQNQIGALPLQLLVPVSPLHRALPVPRGTWDQRAGPCFEVTSSVTFRPTLGQRSSLELCRRICEGSGVERGSLQPALRPKPVYREAVTGVTVPQPQRLQGG